MSFSLQVRDGRNASQCGMAHVSWRRSPQLVPRKKNTVINQYELCAPAAGYDSKLSGGSLPVTRVIACKEHFTAERGFG